MKFYRWKLLGSFLHISIKWIYRNWAYCVKCDRTPWLTCGVSFELKLQIHCIVITMWPFKLSNSVIFVLCKWNIVLWLLFPITSHVINWKLCYLFYNYDLSWSTLAFRNWKIGILEWKHECIVGKLPNMGTPSQYSARI